MPPSDPAQHARSELLARLVEAVHEGAYVGIIGPRENLTIAANPYCRIMLGYPADMPEAELKPFAVDRFTDAGARTVFIDQLARDGAVTDYLLRLRRADGEVIWVEVTASAEISEEAAGVRIEALVRDVSDRKRIEGESRDLYHQLLQAEKMAALGTTISGVAHELNNPLGTILNWAERLASRDLDSPVRRGVETILREAERSARIVRNLLTFARKKHTTRAMVDVNQVIRETLALRAYEQRVTNISVIEALASGIPPVFADPNQIQQVLLNLVINAEHAMLTANGRGTLVVHTWQDPANESVIVEVNDDGPGVPEEVRTKIFDPFFTTKEVGKGTGLGLTVAYAIVEEHGGRMWLASEMGRGSSFYVELPVAGGKLKAVPPVEIGLQAVDVGGAGGEDGVESIAVKVPLQSVGRVQGRTPGRIPGQEEAQEGVREGAQAVAQDAARDRTRPTPARVGSAGRSGAGRRSGTADRARATGIGKPTPASQLIGPAAAGVAPRLDSPVALIVEDEAALADAMQESFTDAGFLVDRAGDGEEALGRLEGGHYDVIISDLKMPRVDGIQFFGIVRERYPDVAGRILFVTGDVLGPDAERFIADSGCRWLAKPFRLAELLRLANEVMGVGGARPR